MFPKVFFKYSGIFDQAIYNFSTGDTKDADDPLFKERKEFVIKKIKEIEKWWNEEGEGVLNKISKVTKIKWVQKEIKVYLLAEPPITASMAGFSEPVTIFLKMKDGREKGFIYIKNTIIHELVHQNIRENYNEYILQLKEKYKCKRTCAVHIIVHAILEQVYNQEELDKESKRKHQPDYEEAWKIVKKEGSKKILKELTNFSIKKVKHGRRK